MMAPMSSPTGATKKSWTTVMDPSQSYLIASKVVVGVDQIKSTCPASPSAIHHRTVVPFCTVQLESQIDRSTEPGRGPQSEVAKQTITAWLC